MVTYTTELKQQATPTSTPNPTTTAVPATTPDPTTTPLPTVAPTPGPDGLPQTGAPVVFDSLTGLLLAISGLSFFGSGLLLRGLQWPSRRRRR